MHVNRLRVILLAVSVCLSVGVLQMVERQRMTVQYSGDSSPDPKQLMAAAQGQAVEEGSVVVSESGHGDHVALVSW